MLFFEELTEKPVLTMRRLYAYLGVGSDFADHRDWEELALLDPFWAIATAPTKRFNRWEAEPFFARGHRQIARLMEDAEHLGYPRSRTKALDFGCGVGRYTRPLADHFEESVGVDVSEEMVAQARQLNREVANCQFVVNVSRDLRDFPDHEFDLVHSRLVLQHISFTDVTDIYIAELVRVLRPGGLLWFQLPSAIPRRYRLGLRRRVYRALRRVGIAPTFLYQRLHLQPMRMTAVADDQVRTLLDTAEARLLDVQIRSTRLGIRDAVYKATRD